MIIVSFKKRYYRALQATIIKKVSSSLLGVSILLLLFTPVLLRATDTYIATNVKGDEEGLNKTIIEAIAKRLKSKLAIELKYRSATFARNLLLMEQGANDLMIFLTKQPERNHYLHYIEPPLFNMNVTFVVRKEEHTLIQSYDDLYNLRIGTSRGAKIFQQFTDDNKIKKSYIISLEQGINKLLLNRLDAVTIPGRIAHYKIWKLGLDNDVAISDYSFRGHKPLYITLSKNAPIMQRLKDVQPLIRNMIESGEIRLVIEQFYTQRKLPIPNLW